MEKKKPINFKKLYKKIAKECDSTPQEVRADIEESVVAYWAREDLSVEQLTHRNSIPRKGERATAEEFITYLTQLDW